MNYNDCNFNDLKSCATLYGLSLKTAKAWAGKSVEPVPWADPARVLEWYRIAFRREPGKRVRERCAILGPQYVAARQVVPGESELVNEDDDNSPVITHQSPSSSPPDLRSMMEVVLGALGSDGTVANIAREELEAYEAYKQKKAAGEDSSVQFSNWKDLTKTKREWMKTPDAVQVALKALKFWTRGEWEQQWKSLRTSLDGRRLGMDARDALLQTGDDVQEWRRVWDMEFERVISEVLTIEDE